MLPIVLLIAAATVGAVLAAVRQRSRDEAPPTKGDLAGGAATVSLVIDFGNGVRREFAALPSREGMTVGDVLRLARESRPPIEYATKGEGEMTFLTALEGVANEGGDGRNWLYSVDGVAGQVSFEVHPAPPGSAVLWEFRGRE
jgi:hypothetical protein